ncbi:trimethyllysine dioxygenase, mitochondrial [Trichonephila clavipes]|nr:trimethyllysine dioxygenase, mitochondrial [Trichonephila clavipes]
MPPDRDPRNSLWQRARLYVCRSLEHHAGDSAIWLVFHPNTPGCGQRPPNSLPLPPTSREELRLDGYLKSTSSGPVPCQHCWERNCGSLARAGAGETTTPAAPLTYLELFSKYKAKNKAIWMIPPVHPWYQSKCPGGFLVRGSSRRDQTALTHFLSDHLMSLTFVDGIKHFEICTKCSSAQASPGHILSCENASQVAEIANGVYGANTVTANYVQFQFRRFRSGTFDVKDAPRTGRPVVENVDKITEIIQVDRHVSSRGIAQGLKIDHKTVLSHLRKVEFKKKLHVCGEAAQTVAKPRLTARIRAGVTAAFVPNDHTTITRTFPTSHHSLKIGFQDNLASNFYYIWLRDNCQCTSCIHSESRQKMVDTVSLDLNIKAQCYHVTDNGKLKIVWPDGHISLYDSDWLHKHGTDFELDSYDNIHDNMPPFTTWDGEMIRNIKPEISYEELMKTEEGLKKWLTMMYKYGIVILKGTPCVKNEVLKVMERIAYVKKTKWGASFDVICKPVQTDPKHLAYTGMYLELHTDMNYLEKSPVSLKTHHVEGLMPIKYAMAQSPHISGVGKRGEWCASSNVTLVL